MANIQTHAQVKLDVLAVLEIANSICIREQNEAADALLVATGEKLKKAINVLLASYRDLMQERNSLPEFTKPSLTAVIHEHLAMAKNTFTIMNALAQGIFQHPSFNVKVKCREIIKITCGYANKEVSSWVEPDFFSRELRLIDFLSPLDSTSHLLKLIGTTFNTEDKIIPNESAITNVNLESEQSISSHTSTASTSVITNSLNLSRHWLQEIIRRAASVTLVTDISQAALTGVSIGAGINSSISEEAASPPESDNYPSPVFRR